MKTKVSKVGLFFAVILGVVVLSSCNEEREFDKDEKSPKEVILKMSFSSSTNLKSVETPILDQSVIDIDRGAIYFTSATGQITKMVTLTSALINEMKTTGASISNVPSNSTAVHIVGNVDGLPTDPGNISTVKEKILNVNLLTNIQSVPLYGSTTGFTGSGPYSSSVSLSTPVARIQIEDLKATGSLITSYKVTGIFVNNYYGSAKVDKTPLGTLINNGSTVANYVSGSAAYPSATLANIYDYDTNGVGTLTSLTYTPAAGKVWAYNIFADGTSKPHIIIRLESLAPAASFTNPMFLTVKSFKSGGSTVEVEGGKIYTFKAGSFTFDGGNLTEQPELSEITVNVSVSLMKWTEVPIEPEY